MRDGGYSWSDGTSAGSLFGGSAEGPNMGQVHRLMDVYERFTAEQIAVSPIDPRGVSGLGLAQLKVEAVAEQSGGEAFYNNNDLKSLIAKAIDDQSHFYTLSYIPPSHQDDSHYHTIKVAVDKPGESGLKLVYRQGYNAERVPHPRRTRPRSRSSSRPPCRATLPRAHRSSSTSASGPARLNLKPVPSPRNYPSPNRTRPSATTSTSGSHPAKSPSSMILTRHTPRIPPVRGHCLQCRPQARRSLHPNRHPQLQPRRLRRLPRPSLPLLPAHRSSSRRPLRPRRHPGHRFQQSRHPRSPCQRSQAPKKLAAPSLGVRPSR